MPIHPERHPLMMRLRELREARGLSLESQASVTGRAGVVVGSYERGDRHATVDVADELLRAYGRKLVDVPLDEPGTPTTMTAPDMVRTLVTIALSLAARYGIEDLDAMLAAQAVGGGDRLTIERMLAAQATPAADGAFAGVAAG